MAAKQYAGMKIQAIAAVKGRALQNRPTGAPAVRHPRRRGNGNAFAALAAAFPPPIPGARRSAATATRERARRPLRTGRFPWRQQTQLYYLAAAFGAVGGLLKKSSGVMAQYVLRTRKTTPAVRLRCWSIRGVLVEGPCGGVAD